MAGRDIFSTPKSWNPTSPNSVENVRDKEVRELRETVLKMQMKIADMEATTENAGSTSEQGDSTGTDKTQLQATRFENTKDLAFAFVVENSTSVTWKQTGNFFCEGKVHEYEKIPAEIPSKDTTSFGFTSDDTLGGFFMYSIIDVYFLLSYKTVNSAMKDFVDVVLVFGPKGRGPLSRDDQGHTFHPRIHNPDHYWWSFKCFVRKQVMTEDFKKDKELNITAKYGKLEASVVVKTGKKILVTVKITEN